MFVYLFIRSWVWKPHFTARTKQLSRSKTFLYPGSHTYNAYMVRYQPGVRFSFVLLSCQRVATHTKKQILWGGGLTVTWLRGAVLSTVIRFGKKPKILNPGFLKPSLSLSKPRLEEKRARAFSAPCVHTVLSPQQNRIHSQKRKPVFLLSAPSLTVKQTTTNDDKRNNKQQATSNNTLSSIDPIQFI